MMNHLKKEDGGRAMARLVFSMNVSLDGYVDHQGFAPGPDLFRHFVAEARSQAGSFYGTTMYGIMRYWDEDLPDWSDDERDFAAAWRAQRKWVVARSLGAADLGPNAELVDFGSDGADPALAVRRIADGVAGEIEVAGPQLGASFGALGLLEEYRMYLHPVVLGGGARYFAEGHRPALSLVSQEAMGEGVVRIVYRPVASV